MFAGDRTGETVTQNMREERCWDTNSDKDHVTEITANNQDINLTGISQNLRGGERAGRHSYQLLSDVLS